MLCGFDTQFAYCRGLLQVLVVCEGSQFVVWQRVYASCVAALHIARGVS